MGRVRADVSQAVQHELPGGYTKSAAGGGDENSGKCNCSGSRAGSCTSKGASLAWIKLARSHQVKTPESRGAGRGEGI